MTRLTNEDVGAAQTRTHASKQWRGSATISVQVRFGPRGEACGLENRNVRAAHIRMVRSQEPLQIILPVGCEARQFTAAVCAENTRHLRGAVHRVRLQVAVAKRKKTTRQGNLWLTLFGRSSSPPSKREEFRPWIRWQTRAPHLLALLEEWGWNKHRSQHLGALENSPLVPPSRTKFSLHSRYGLAALGGHNARTGSRQTAPTLAVITTTQNGRRPEGSDAADPVVVLVARGWVGRWCRFDILHLDNFLP